VRIVCDEVNKWREKKHQSLQSNQTIPCIRGRIIFQESIGGNTPEGMKHITQYER
jgi:hypothetical protein